MKELTSENFKEEIATGLVLVDFWAPWCGPCRALTPLLEKVADELGDKVSFYKVDTQDNEALAREYEIRSIPAIKLFKDGKVIDEFMGLRPKPAIIEFINAHL